METEKRTVLRPSHYGQQRRPALDSVRRRRPAQCQILFVMQLHFEGRDGTALHRMGRPVEGLSRGSHTFEAQDSP